MGLPRGRHKSPAHTFSSRTISPQQNCFYFLQSPYLFTIDRLFPSIVEMFRINFYRVSLDFSFRNTKLIVVYVIERITTPIRKRNTIVNSRTSGKNHTTGYSQVRWEMIWCFTLCVVPRGVSWIPIDTRRWTTINWIRNWHLSGANGRSYGTIYW